MNTIELEKKVKQLVHSLAYEKGFVCSVDVLIGLNYLSTADYESWRFGKVEYLEKVCKANLSKLSLINKAIRKNATELKLERSWTGYHKFGKGVSKKLIFSKSKDQKIEDAYATHYLNKKRILELKGNKASV
ncbi:MAG: hypothetical protein ABIN67_15635 [Ferruginibacter sp.]